MYYHLKHIHCGRTDCSFMYVIEYFAIIRYMCMYSIKTACENDQLAGSVAVLAEISLRSPRKLFIFIIYKIIYRIKVPKKQIIWFWKKLHCLQDDLTTTFSCFQGQIKHFMDIGIDWTYRLWTEPTSGSKDQRFAFGCWQVPLLDCLLESLYPLGLHTDSYPHATNTTTHRCSDRRDDCHVKHTPANHPQFFCVTPKIIYFIIKK